MNLRTLVATGLGVVDGFVHRGMVADGGRPSVVVGWLAVPPVAALLPNDPTAALVVGDVLAAVALFAAWEVASGAPREAGKDL